jgi:Protein of unknown function (DUF2637)
MTADRDKYRTMTAVAVLLVAAIAAAVSFLHLAALAIRYGQPLVAAYLLPVSIDGVVATSSLVLLRAARTGVSAPWLARLGLVLSIVATLAGNVASGLDHGWQGALVASWPPIGFVLSAETAISMTRRRQVSVTVPDRSPTADTTRPPTRTTRPPKRTPATDAKAVVMSALAADPDMTTGQLATLTGVSDRTVRRVRAAMNGAST